MATAALLSSATNHLVLQRHSSSSSSSCGWRAGVPRKQNNSVTAVLLCKSDGGGGGATLTKRGLLLSLSTAFSLVIAKGNWSNAAILEADDDLELLEKVKKDRKKRLERQEVISSSNKEAAYVQEVVYKLSKAGQAIENNDLTAATSVLGPTTDTDWVKKGNAAFTKLTASSEEEVEVEAFNSSLASLISSAAKNDIKSSKIAFVSSATALEKWAALTGLAALLKGL